MVQADEQLAQIKEVIAFLDNKAARTQAIEILLSFSATLEQRAGFQQTDIVKRLLRLILDQDSASGADHNLAL
jgi:hypothetical protein